MTVIHPVPSGHLPFLERAPYETLPGKSLVWHHSIENPKWYSLFLNRALLESSLWFILFWENGQCDSHILWRKSSLWQKFSLGGIYLKFRFLGKTLAWYSPSQPTTSNGGTLYWAINFSSMTICVAVNTWAMIMRRSPVRRSKYTLRSLICCLLQRYPNLRLYSLALPCLFNIGLLILLLLIRQPRGNRQSGTPCQGRKLLPVRYLKGARGCLEAYLRPFRVFNFRLFFASINTGVFQHALHFSHQKAVTWGAHTISF